MKKILLLALILFISVIFLSIFRFGFTFDAFMQGDGNALLYAASSLIVIWALVISLTIAMIGAIFEISKLPSRWKMRILRRESLRWFLSFLILAFISGLIPFFAIFNIDSKIGVFESPVTHWLILDFALQLLLIFGAIKVSLSIYENMTLVPAIKSTLTQMDDSKLKKINELYSEAFFADYREGHFIPATIISGFGRSLSGKGEEYHDEILTVFLTLFQESNPQTLDSGVRAISEWIETKSLKKLDGYFNARIILPCFSMLRADRTTYFPVVFEARLYYLTRLVVTLQEAGAPLAVAHAGNHMWTLIIDFSKKEGMSTAIEQAEIAIELLLQYSHKRKISSNILLNDLLKGVKQLVSENSSKSLIMIDRVIRWHRRELQFVVFRTWPDKRVEIEGIINAMKDVYELIENGYGEEAALAYDLVDVRYTILTTLRRLQETFVSVIQPSEVKPKNKKDAADDFEFFNRIIKESIAIRKPQGDERGYDNTKYKSNPYLE